MKKLVAAVVAFSAFSSIAIAQSAYNPDEGSPPQSYPPCTHPHQDRCVVGGGQTAHHAHHAHKSSQ